MTRFFLAATLLLTGLTTLSAQTSQPASSPQTQTQPLSREDQAKLFVSLQQDMARLFQEKEYAKAAETCQAFVKLFPQLPMGYYNLACAQARLGKTDEALASLKKAIELGYDESDHMAADEDLASLAGTKEFKELVELAQKAAQKYLKYDEMPGIKTVARTPKDALPYRIRMSPSATKDKPNKLLIWMHPSGGSANSVVEPMADMFLKYGYALMVFPKKNFAYWSELDAKMMTLSVKDAADIEGIDAAKPILMGFSAGGQMALMIYGQNASKLGGLILDAAYPVSQGPDNKYQVTAPPDTPAVADVPILVLVGLKDNLCRVWQKVEPQWLEKKVPLTVLYVPNAGHAWLLGEKQAGNRAELEKWLEAVAAGKKPSSQPASSPASSPAATQPTVSSK